jgi:hypothetical protein
MPRTFTLKSRDTAGNIEVAHKPVERVSAILAEPERFTSKDFFTSCPQYFCNYMYCRSSLYDEQLSRYFILFDRAQFHVLSLAELASNPTQTIDAISAFLDIDPAPLRPFANIASNRDGNCEPHDADAGLLMDAMFNGLTERTDRLVGRLLDRSL